MGSSAQWSAQFKGRPIVDEGILGLVLRPQGELLERASVVRTKTHAFDQVIPVLFGKASKARDRYQELRVEFQRPDKIRFAVVFRAYDDAVAFRYEIPAQKGLSTLVIQDETTAFRLSGHPTAYVQFLEHYNTSHEHNVAEVPLSGIKADTLLDLPITFARPDGISLAITEAALRRYAGLSLMRPGGQEQLSARLTPRADGTKVVATLPLRTPWRVVLVGDSPGALLESNTLYCLNDPPAFKDTSWIRPGKMTWPWWNGHLYEAQPTKPILSMEAIRQYIDFCAENGIAFHSVVSDEKDRPWYVQQVDGLFPGPGTEVTQIRPDLDLPAIRRYAESKGIRLWTWVHQGALRGKVEDAFAAFEKMGWAGMMVDFFDHDDQETVEFAEEILQAAARHHILIHFHGIWKPTGWQRTYPNLMNHEGVLNLEYLKWGDNCSPEHDLRIAFTRALAGPLDYHLGGFRAVSRADFKPHHVGPNVLGTRAHQLAMYVCWDNPNPMVADYPAAYRNQPGFEFIREVPAWWDETRILAGEVGKLLVTARRKGNVWWLGGMWAGPPGKRSIPLDRLGKGPWKATVWSDLPESETDPNRIGKRDLLIESGKPLEIEFGTDGGFVAKLVAAGGRKR